MQRYIINRVKVDFVVNPSSNIYESEILQNDKSTQLGTLRIAKDPFDVEGIENAVMEPKEYHELKKILIEILEENIE